jgi:hypothetical protein
MAPLTGTADAGHMRADLEVFDFCRKPEEVERIEGLTLPSATSPGGQGLACP